MNWLWILPLALAPHPSPGPAGLAATCLSAEDFEALEVEWTAALSNWLEEVEAIRASGGRRSAQPPHPALRFAPRYETLAGEGEGRAVLWLLDNLREAREGISERRVLTRRIFDWVEAAGDVPWVPRALLALGDLRRDLDEERLKELVNTLAEEGRSPDAQAAALLVRARGWERRDRAKAELIRFKLGRACHERDVALELSPILRDALAQALIGDLERLRQQHFAASYEEQEDGRWVQRADAPPDPDGIYEPMLSALAEAGGVRARVWVLTDSRQLDEETAALKRTYLEALAREGLSGNALSALLRSARSLVWTLGIDVVEPALRELVAHVPVAERAGALFALGMALCEVDGEPAEEGASTPRERGLELLREVVAGWPASSQARQAEAKLLRFTYLVVGKEAPELELEDVDGNAFRLSEYRGKVTVIDFWGFW